MDHYQRSYQFSSVQSLRHVRLFATPWITAHQASLSIINSWTSRKLSIESVIPSSYLILCHPLLLRPSIPPSIRVFSNESALHIRWPKYWNFSLNISPSNEHPGLIFFRMDWLDLLAVQGTPKSLLQHHSSKRVININSSKNLCAWKGTAVFQLTGRGRAAHKQRSWTRTFVCWDHYSLRRQEFSVKDVASGCYLGIQFWW